jgi:hypothetical protein
MEFIYCGSQNKDVRRCRTGSSGAEKKTCIGLWTYFFNGKTYWKGGIWQTSYIEGNIKIILGK